MKFRTKHCYENKTECMETFVKYQCHCFSFKWETPELSVGSRVKGYVIEAQQKGVEKREYTVVCKTKSTSATAVGLCTGADYYFRIKAFNDCGMSDQRDLVSSVNIREPKEAQNFKEYDFCCALR